MNTIMASKEIEDLLRRFDAAVVRTWLSPEDHKRFREIIRAAHRADQAFSGQALKEWLTAKGWPDGVVEVLVERFEYCRLLMGGQ